MKPEEQKSIKLEYDAYIYLEKKLDSIAVQIERTANKKKEKQEAREMKLLEYKTEDEIQDAYGWNYISEKEKDHLLAKLNGVKEKAALPCKEKIALVELQSMLKTVRSMKNDLEFELMSEKEKQQHRNSAEGWKKKIAELRTKKERKS